MYAAKGREELDLEERCRERAKACGWMYRKVTFIGVRGAPDDIFGKGGDCVLVEFKVPGEQPTLQQSKRHRELREVFGLRVAWTDSYAGFCQILGIAE